MPPPPPPPVKEFPIIYVIIVILYIEIFLFMFNPKIKTQILLCAVPVTIILFTVLFKNAFQESPMSRDWMIGGFIGVMAVVTCIGILNTAIVEYNTDIKSANDKPVGTKLSKSNVSTVKTIKNLFISNIIFTALIGFIIAPDTTDQIKLIIDKFDLIIRTYSEYNRSISDAIKTLETNYSNLYYSILLLILPFALIEIVIKYVFNMLSSKPNSVLSAGLIYIFGSSVYIMSESTRLSRLVIAE